MNDNALFDVIKYALWGSGTAAAEREIYTEMKLHAISALPAPVLAELSISPELLNVWQKEVVRQVSKYYQFIKIQSVLPVSVPYVVLKGTSAAQYYPFPEYRTMGDIDIMTGREDYEAACQMLLNGGYNEILHTENTRHREFQKQNIVVEVHAYFASLNDPVQAKYLDDLIMENIGPTHVLPHLVNGLVLLEHISQHLEHGLGLRQIIDWMMFVDKCLPDGKWPELQKHAQSIGLEKLAVTATGMCQIYLGLPERHWCSDADASLCKRLMEYVLSCGNFGSKWEEDERKRITKITYSRTPKAAFRLLQKNGMANWKAASKYMILRPFAWLYQAGFYIIRDVKQGTGLSRIKREVKDAKQRNKLFDNLGVKQRYKGLVVFKDGKYVKE